MNNFSIRSIGLYSLAIAGVIIGFNLIASYGEANIRAPVAVQGVYRIAAQNFPGCLQTKSLLLVLQQSGIYLHASLVPDLPDANPLRDRRPPLAGNLEQREISLIGKLPPEVCPQQSIAQMKGTVRDGKLQGQLWLDRATQPQTFTGIITTKLTTSPDRSSH